MLRSRDLAAELGISTAALSQIIHGAGRCSAETRERVLARVREVGYVPHAGARSARCRRFDAIALVQVVDEGRGGLDEALFNGCLLACGRLGQRLVAEAISPRGLAADAGRHSLLAARSCDGLLVNHHLAPDAAVQRLIAACRVPVRWLNRRAGGGGIHPDDRGAAREAALALLARGRRRLAFVDGHHGLPERHPEVPRHDSVEDRWAGVVEAARSAGVPVERPLAERQPPWEVRVAGLAARIAAPDGPDGLVCYHPSDTAVVLEALARLGRRPGVEAGVVQFAARPGLLGRPIATQVLPFQAMGELAVERLVAAVAAGDAGPAPDEAVPCRLVAGESL